jgi:hypothetical protein
MSAVSDLVASAISLYFAGNIIKMNDLPLIFESNLYLIKMTTCLLNLPDTRVMVIEIYLSAILEKI